MTRVLVIGGGVAGCAAAVAAAEGGAEVVLLDRRRHPGGVAAQGEHRTICGLAPIDADEPVLLEPGLTAPWVDALATGPAFRRGRVWLWPTTSDALHAGLQRRLAAAGVRWRVGDPRRITIADGALVAVDGEPCSAVIDAAGALPELLGLATEPARQWGAQRHLLQLPWDTLTHAERVRLLGRIAGDLRVDAACAMEPLGDGRWQLSIDRPPGSSAAEGAALAESIAAAWSGSLLASGCAVAERDARRLPGGLSVDALFGARERGLCWAAWPMEWHGPTGVTWRWPGRDRHGVPESCVQSPALPQRVWQIGKALPVSAEAAAALRVIGTALAIGTALGRRVAGA